MLESIQNTPMQNREEAGLILGHRLQRYEKTDSIVVGIPCGGVSVAAALADYLSLPLEVIPCKRIKHPARDNKNLGSVSLSEVFLYETERIPQDFVAHQIALLKNANAFEHQFYHKNKLPLTLRYKTVIVVDDLLKSSEVMLACVREIKKQQPLKIIVAVPVVSAEAARIVSAEVDEVVFLKMEHQIRHSRNYFQQYNKIGRDEVKDLIESSQKIMMKST